MEDVLAAKLNARLLAQRRHVANHAVGVCVLGEESEFNYFKIVLSVGVDYGHPHYDLKYTSLERK